MTDAVEPPDAGAPVTRREFDTLVEAVRALAAAVGDHCHGYADPDSTYGSDTYGPDDACGKALERIGKVLDGLSKPKDRVTAS